jgi:hypothetical protein
MIFSPDTLDTHGISYIIWVLCVHVLYSVPNWYLIVLNWDSLYQKVLDFTKSSFCKKERNLAISY